MREEIKVNNNISNYYPHMSNYNQDEFAVSLKDWFREGHSEEEYRNLFVYMSLAMKYIHDQGRYVASFSLASILVKNIEFIFTISTFPIAIFNIPIYFL